MKKKNIVTRKMTIIIGLFSILLIFYVTSKIFASIEKESQKNSMPSISNTICEKIDRLYVVENSFMLTLNEFEKILDQCVGNENIFKESTIEASNNQRKIKYLGFGTIYYNKDNESVVRMDVNFADRNNLIYSDYFSKYAENDFVFDYITSPTSGIKYNGYVWLEEGILLIGFEQEGKIYVVGISRFENIYDQDSFMDTFTKREDTRLTLSTMEI